MTIEIIDLNSRSNDSFKSDIPQQLRDGLSRPPGHKRIPTILLYDERGLKLFDDMTTKAPEYYIFPAEEEILKNGADDIIRTMHGENRISSNEVVVELGAGALRKTSHVLLGLARFVGKAKASSPVTYYALDLVQQELERTLSEIETSELGEKLAGRVETKGMCGTFNDGLKFIKEGGLFNGRFTNSFPTSIEPFRYSPSISPTSSGCISTEVSESDSSPLSTPEEIQPPLHFLFFGASLGNFPREEAADFLRSLPLRPGSGDTILVGFDHDNDKEKIEKAYNDSKGYTANFVFNGLRSAGRVLGNEKMFDEDKWDYVNHYNIAERRHEAFIKAKGAHTIHEPSHGQDITFLNGELIKIGESFKFSDRDCYTLFTKVNLRPVQRWTDKMSQYSIWLLERPPFSFPLLSTPSFHDTVRQSQKYYDLGPFGVPSREDWTNIWNVWDFVTRRMIPSSMLFQQKPIHLSKIPTILDIHLSNLLQEANTEPTQFKDIFERGIDPDAGDPTQCHLGTIYPSQNAVLNFQSSLQTRLLNLYDDIDSGEIPLTRKIARVLFMVLEHQAMQIETLLYMLVQRAGSGTLPPTGFITPSWTSLAENWNTRPAPQSKTVTLGPAVVSLGHDDDEADDDISRFRLEGHEFGWDNEHPKRQVDIRRFKIEWRPVTNSEFYQFYIGTKSGQISFPASWVDDGGIIKVRTLYGPVPLEIAAHWPIVTSYDNLSIYATAKGGRMPTEPELRLFNDNFDSGYAGGANVGFRNWHPVPATTGGERNGGKGSNGGVWEWTSTVFNKVDGFVPSKLYPGYSMDLYDGKHQVVLGGSYGTIPRISERRSFRNWYQRNYPHPWVGGRVAYDITN